MSTKSTISHGANFHLYHEVFDPDNVYLELEHALFEASPDKVTFAIPVVIWEAIRQCAGTDLSWAIKSDAEVLQWVENAVDERIALSQADSANSKLIRRWDNQTYGSVDDPREMQIERGLVYFSEKRDKQRSLVAQVNELVANQG